MEAFEEKVLWAMPRGISFLLSISQGDPDRGAADRTGLYFHLRSIITLRQLITWCRRGTAEIAGRYQRQCPGPLPIRPSVNAIPICWSCGPDPGAIENCRTVAAAAVSIHCREIVTSNIDKGVTGRSGRPPTIATYWAWPATRVPSRILMIVGTLRGPRCCTNISPPPGVAALHSK